MWAWHVSGDREIPCMKRQTRRRIRYSIILVLVLLVLSSPLIIWIFLPVSELGVLVLDKTVPEIDCQEHRSFFWILNHFKYGKPQTKQRYDYKRDYYGYFPESGSADQDSTFDCSQADVVYLTDSYGIYQYPVDYKTYEHFLPDRYVPIKLRYGGISEREADELLRYNRLGRTTIGEFNILGSPTYTNKHVQEELEGLFSVRYEGIWGKYYERLQDASKWMKDAYEFQEHKPWDFKGWGIIIVDEGFFHVDGKPKLTVLDQDDLHNPPMTIRKQTDVLMKNVATEIPYFNWFEIVRASDHAKPMAIFDVRCRESGTKKMKASGLNLSFPAIVASDSSHRNFYFAGDFADNNVSLTLTPSWGEEYILERLYYFYMVSDQSRFYWRFYVPFMSNVLDACHQQRINRTR